MKSPVVASLRAAREIARHFDAVITIESPSGPPSLRCGAEEGPHQLVLSFDDVEAAWQEFVLPDRRMIEKAVAFARRSLAGDLLIHCEKGISRSPAIALVVLADWYGSGAEDEAVAHLHDLCPKAAPNRLVVALGDRILMRNGALMAAMLRHPAMNRRLALKDALMRRLRMPGFVQTE